MQKKLIKVKLCILLSLAFVLLTVPLSSVKAAFALGKIGQGCTGVEDCKVTPDFNYTNWKNVSTPYSTNVECKASRCVVPEGDVAIGTWCNSGVQCEDETGTMQFTCDTNESFCVAGVRGVSCVDDLARLNKDANIGTLGTDIDEPDRCGPGLVCDKDASICENDFGQGAVPTDKLGETAEDIRDQIRNVINIALGFLGVGGVIVTIYGGALWMSAAGDDEKVGKAKKTIVSGLIGLVIIGIAWTIVSYVLTITQDIA